MPHSGLRAIPACFANFGLVQHSLLHKKSPADAEWSEALCDVKELCRLAGINEEIRITTYKGNVRTDEIHPKWELVGTHTGRRTFIVNALSLGIPPNIVMKWTGHSDYSSMKPYIDIVDDIKATSMTKFNGLLEKND